MLSIVIYCMAADSYLL